MDHRRTLVALAIVALILASSATPSMPAAAQDEPTQQLTASVQDFPLVVQTLHQGWNLVGWAGASSGPEAFDFVTGDFGIGFTYDGARQVFESFSPDAPPILNSLNQLDFGDGVWIFTDEETTWVQPAPWWQRDVPLRSGFNLVLWTGGNGTPVEEAVGELGAALTGLFTWDPAAQTFLSYDPGRPDFLNTARTLDYGDGVWIEVNRSDLEPAGLAAGRDARRVDHSQGLIGRRRWQRRRRTHERRPTDCGR